jgi:protein TonB
VLGALRDWWFGLVLGFSALLHALAILFLGLVEFVPPAEIAPKPGKFSVRLVASADAQPEPVKRLLKEKAQPAEPPPTDDVPPLPATEEPAVFPRADIQPQPAPPEPRQPQPLARIVEDAPAPKPDKTKRMAKVSSVASQASEASEGAVDQFPEEAVNPAPPYPPEARDAGQEGRVWLRVKVDATGRVTAISVYESSGYPLLDDSALRTVRRWIYNPAKRNGKPVPYEYLKPVGFYIRRM